MKLRLCTALLNLSTVDSRMLICMTNTTADTDEDAASLSAIGTLDEYDGSAYVRKTMGGEAIAQDATNDRAEFTVTSPIVWTALGAGTRSGAGILLYEYVDGTAANDRPIAWFDAPFTGNGTDVTATVASEGLLFIS
jgi:hypothetical protein